jgi:hypothetical protein
MKKLAISTVLERAGKARTRKEKVDWLKQNQSVPLMAVLRLMYDENVEFLLPDVAPPYKKNASPDEGMMLYHEYRKLRIFVRGGGYDTLNQIKRETLFIGLLEDVCDSDSEMLCLMITGQRIKGLTKEAVEEAFPRIFLDPIKLS